MAGAGAGADSLLEMVAAAAARGGDRPFLWARRDGLYRPLSWRPGSPPRCGPWPAPSPRPGLAPGDRAVIVA
ncbi:MAG TPA: hypothetical protein VFG47_07870, partial [Geminicoccaceae bacterium]|nr:hypothetical protein [Geminicoccaceae bacterium]